MLQNDKMLKNQLNSNSKLDADKLLSLDPNETWID